MFRRVVDQVTTSIDERLSVNRQIIQDTACVDPRRFSELIDDGVAENSMEKLAQLTGLCASSLRSELLWFVRNVDMLSLWHEFEAAVSDGDELCSNSSNNESEAECAVVLDDTEVKQSQRAKCNGVCKQCLLCCYRILYRCALNAFLAYEYLTDYTVVHTSELRTSVQQTEIDQDHTVGITE